MKTKTIVMGLLAATMSALLVSCATTPTDPTPLQWRLEGFDMPESAVMDPQTKKIYVSNIEGSPMATDGKGSISLVSADGKMLNRRFTDGLDAPKGLALSGDVLYVADMKNLRSINRLDGVLIESWNAPDAVMLNDPAVAADGTVYVSDLVGGSLYRLKEGNFEKWKTFSEIPHPNGLVFKDGKLLIANWGTGMQDDFTTSAPGSLYSYDFKKDALSIFEGGENIGNLDGLALEPYAVLVSNWITGDIYRIAGGKHITLLNPGKSAADISVQGDMLLIPMMTQGVLEARTLK